MSSSSRTNIPNSLNEHWMPFTDNKTFKKNPRLITDAKGVYLTNHQGKKMIDASSGLFCNPLGHGRKEITEAVSKQLEKLDYCQPFNQGYGGSFELATRIAKKTPEGISEESIFEMTLSSRRAPARASRRASPGRRAGGPCSSARWRAGLALV